jgi:acyl dehydratase
VNGTGEPADALPDWTLDRVDPERMKQLALLLADPNPIHFDREAAAKAGFAERVSQGPASMAMLMNMLLAAFPGGAVSRLRVRLQGTVLAGQSVRAAGRVTARERDEDGTELVSCEVILETGDGTVVMTGDAAVRLPASGTGA